MGQAMGEDPVSAIPPGVSAGRVEDAVDIHQDQRCGRLHCPRGPSSGSGRYSTDKDEVGGSSPPRPTTQTPRPAARSAGPAITIKRHACPSVSAVCPIASLGSGQSTLWRWAVATAQLAKHPLDSISRCNRRLMFPDADDLPTPAGQLKIGAPITFHVPIKLLPPPVTVITGGSPMIGTAVPEAAIHHH